MKKILSIALALLFVSSVAIAQITVPFSIRILWDPSPTSEGVNSYNVTLDGTPIPATNISCTTTVCTATANIAVLGSHTVTVTAVNDWGVGAPAVVTFNVVAAGRVNNVKVQKN